jgi:ankyrin repeat protein
MEGLVWDAIKLDDAVTMERLLKEHQLDVNQTDYYGWGYVTLSCSRNSRTCLQKLIEMKANLDQEDQMGTRPLTNAITNGYTGCVTLLLQAKADVDKITKYGHSPLSWAARHDKYHMVSLLIEAKASLHTGPDPLAIAISYSCIDTVEVLIDTGAYTIDGYNTQAWVSRLFGKRKKSKAAYLTLYGILRRRAPHHVKIPLDMVRMISMRLWDTRFSHEWE